MAKQPTSAAKFQPLVPPPGGAAVRMYRIGHGDCFLIAFDGGQGKPPAYVMIDCGYKPGSPGKLTAPTKAKDVAADIIAVTGGKVDVAVVTHEHQDHVNAITNTNFKGLSVGEVWFAWTENPADDIANQLRVKFKDRLLGLLDRRAALMAAPGDSAAKLADYVELMLQYELGEDEVAEFNGKTSRGAAGKEPSQSANKLAMQYLVKAAAPNPPNYLYPHEKPRAVPNAKAARAFVLGPPRDMDKIDDLDPIGGEVFGDDDHGMAAAAGGKLTTEASLFPRFATPLDEAFERKGYFEGYYGKDKVPEAKDGEEVAPDAEWRRLSADDASDAGALALAMNNATNNASLVLAFELGKGGKVLLFVGDAQAGNWRSWSEGDFTDGSEVVTAKSLLNRTVLYKGGHHGSHNATLNGKPDDTYANLSWMAAGAHASEFVAMITAVEAWAHQKPKPDWNHPLPAIKEALMQKAGGRVLQTDSAIPDTSPVPAGASGWAAFRDRVVPTDLYFDLKIEP